MVMVRNRSLWALLVVTAVLVPPAWATPRKIMGQLAQAPESLTPAFTLPESLPAETALTIDGTPTMAAINRALTQRFEARFGNVQVTVQQRGSEAALQALQAGELDLAAVGRPLSEAEKTAGLTAVPISREKIAVIVSSQNPFEGNLTFQEFAQIFRGEITNWAQVGGADRPIRFIDRPAGSDTRRALSDYDIFQNGEFATGDTAVTVETDSTAAVVAALGADGIGYAIAHQVENQGSVRPLPLNGTLPDDPRYPYSQPRGYVYQGTPDPAVEAFLALATAPEGQAAVAEAQAAEAADVATAALPDRVVAVRPNGAGFVTGDREGNLTFWNADGTVAGEPVSAHNGPVTALSFSPDGQRLISGGATGVMRFWDAVGTPVGEPITAAAAPITSLAMLPQGGFFSGSGSGTLQRWDNEGNPTGVTIDAHAGAVRATAVMPDGQTLVSGGEDGAVRLWNLDGTARLEPLTGHSGPVTALAIAADGMIISGGEDGTLRRWDTAGSPLGEPLTATGPVTALTPSPDGDTFASGDDTGTAQVWNADGTPAGEPVSNFDGAIDAIAYSPSGEQLIVVAGDGEPQIRSRTGEVLPPTAEATSPPDEPAATPTLPPEVSNLWQRLQNLPPQVLWLIPVAVLALLLLALWRSWQRDAAAEEAEEAEAEAEVATAAETPTETEADARTAGPPSAIAGVSSQEAADSLDPQLSRARAALVQGLSQAQAGDSQGALESFNSAVEAADVERLKAIAAGIGVAGVAALIARGLAHRGSMLTNLGRPQAALKSFDQALETDPDDLEAWIGKGKLLLQMQRLDEALFCFDKATELNPKSAAAWRGKGQVLQQLDQTAQARQCFDRAEQLGDADETATAFQAGVGDSSAAAIAAGAEALDRLTVPSTTAETERPESPDKPEEPEEPEPDTEPAPPAAPADEAESSDVPSDVQAEIAALPSTPDVPPQDTPYAPPIAVPPEVQQILDEIEASQGTSQGQGASSPRRTAMGRPLPPPPPSKKPADADAGTANDDVLADLEKAIAGTSEPQPAANRQPPPPPRSSGAPQPPPPPSNTRLRRDPSGAGDGGSQSPTSEPPSQDSEADNGSA